MPTRLTASCGAFRRHSAWPLEESWLTQATVAGAAAPVTPAAPTFALPYMAALAPFRGVALEFAVLVRAAAQDGNDINMILDAAPSLPHGARHVARGLPATYAPSPVRVWTGLGIGYPTVTVLPGRDGAEVRATVSGGRHVQGGRVRVVGREWTDDHEGSTYYHEPYVSGAFATLVAAGDGTLAATLVLPQDTDAPATLDTAHVSTHYGFAWAVEAELEGPGGHGRTLFAPFRVGVDRS